MSRWGSDHLPGPPPVSPVNARVEFHLRLGQGDQGPARPGHDVERGLSRTSGYLAGVLRNAEKDRHQFEDHPQNERTYQGTADEYGSGEAAESLKLVLGCYLHDRSSDDRGQAQEVEQ